MRFQFLSTSSLMALVAVATTALWGYERMAAHGERHQGPPQHRVACPDCERGDWSDEEPHHRGPHGDHAGHFGPPPHDRRPEGPPPHHEFTGHHGSYHAGPPSHHAGPPGPPPRHEGGCPECERRHSEHAEHRGPHHPPEHFAKHHGPPGHGFGPPEHHGPPPHHAGPPGPPPHHGQHGCPDCERSAGHHPGPPPMHGEHGRGPYFAGHGRPHPECDAPCCADRRRPHPQCQAPCCAHRDFGPPPGPHHREFGSFHGMGRRPLPPGRHPMTRALAGRPGRGPQGPPPGMHGGPFREMDGNHDGKLSKEEVMTFFTKLDANQDGSVTPDEIHEHVAAKMKELRGEHRGPKHDDEKAHHDGDKGPHHEEHGKSGRPGPGGPPEFGGPKGPGEGAPFHRPQVGPPGAGGPPPGPHGPPPPEMLFEHFDKNDDDKLTKDEVPFWDRLSQADANKDGSVTKDELHAHMREKLKSFDFRGEKRDGDRKEKEGDKKDVKKEKEPAKPKEEKSEKRSEEDTKKVSDNSEPSFEVANLPQDESAFFRTE